MVKQGDKQEPVSGRSAKHHLLVAKELNVEGKKNKNCITQGGTCCCDFVKCQAVKFLLNMYVCTHGPELLPALVSGQMHDW